MPQECIGMFIETRNMLISRNQVVPGGQMVDGNSDFDPDSLSTSSFDSLNGGSSIFSGTSTSALEINYLLTRRSDISIAVDEMIRNRGRYGPDIVQEDLSAVDSIVAIQGGENNASSIFDETNGLTTKPSLNYFNTKRNEMEEALEMI